MEVDFNYFISQIWSHFFKVYFPVEEIMKMSPIFPGREDEFDDPKFLKEAETGKKKKKSWKSSLFSWFKNADKKNKTEPLDEGGPAATPSRQRRRGVFSGQVDGGGGPRKTEDDGSRTPYVNLRHINSSPLAKSQPYGPVYFVP